jgi:prepilin-type processing-associated H-X9-DG protein
MAFVMVLSYSRYLFLRFYQGAAMSAFLDGHVRAFSAFGAVPRTVLYDFVPGNKIRLLCPAPLCG